MASNELVELEKGVSLGIAGIRGCRQSFLVGSCRRCVVLCLLEAVCAVSVKDVSVLVYSVGSVSWVAYRRSICRRLWGIKLGDFLGGISKLKSLMERGQFLDETGTG